MINVSIIIPVYKAEQWIEQCARSLFNQTLDEIEFIFVDDCSPDSSIDILQTVLKEYPKRKEQIIIISHKKNQGVAAARTTGIKAASGDYIIHCDPDDWVEPYFCEALYNKAVLEEADIVACDYYESLNGGSEIVITHEYPTTSPQQLVHDIYKNPIPTFCWMLLMKRELFTKNNILPFEGINSGEDLNVVFRVMFFAKKIVHIDKPLYHYERRTNSISLDSNYSKLWNNYVVNNIAGLEDFIKQQNAEDEFNITLNYLKFSKKMFLLAGKKPLLNLWFQSYPESNKDIMKYASYPLRTRRILNVCSKSYIILWFYFKILRKILK